MKRETKRWKSNDEKRGHKNHEAEEVQQRHGDGPISCKMKLVQEGRTENMCGASELGSKESDPHGGQCLQQLVPP
ncbi:hypothetical protein GDO81_026794 [Engystomops pustulosus]|uniref:Uncharacterized protein n=1 Tax=Engystomops pustulosus TaxID=76066 RepID=A0AAV6YHU2_ENGPU|nr:hypothetical protein GDO81_026794 [Engystomops pustulosus]